MSAKNPSLASPKIDTIGMSYASFRVGKHQSMLIHFAFVESESAHFQYSESMNRRTIIPDGGMKQQLYQKDISRRAEEATKSIFIF